MTLTYPRICLPVVTAGAQEITITYTGAGAPGADTVSFTAGTYYANRTANSDSLLNELYTRINTQVAISVPGMVMTMLPDFATGTLEPTGRLRMGFSGGGTVEVSQIEFTTATYLSAKDFGFALTSATTVIAFATGVADNTANGDYRIPSCWIPDSLDYDPTATQKDTAIVQTLGHGGGDADVYVGPKAWEHVLVEVAAVLVRAQYASDADYVGRVSGLTSGDTHASLEAWLLLYQDLLGGAIPVCQWVPDYVTSVPRDVYLQDPRLIGGVEGWITATNQSPDWHDLELVLVEKVT
ncbi:MAG: hypothetical protein GY778_16065 [bacterium]|nr:hypothetical protein [bacterium]